MKQNEFTGGSVTFSFDDGWLCTYQNGFPILQKAGLKGTYYIISGCLDPEQFLRYMKIGEVKELAEAGNEIGCHSVSHKHLKTETLPIIEEEVVLSRKYLEKNIGSIDTFAYPYGEYDERVLDIVKKAGFTGARSTITGFNDEKTDPFLLKCLAVSVDVRLPRVKEWVDYAKSNNVWLILMFHQIDYEGRQWSTTPEILQEIVNYLKETKIPVITIKEGLQRIA